MSMATPPPYHAVILHEETIFAIYFAVPTSNARKIARERLDGADEGGTCGPRCDVVDVCDRLR
jgi:hypothetical protein